MKTFYKIMQYLFPFLTTIGLIVYKYNVIEKGAVKDTLEIGSLLIIAVTVFFAFKIIKKLIAKIKTPFTNAFLTFIFYSFILMILLVFFNTLQQHLGNLAFVSQWSILGVLGGAVFKCLYMFEANKQPQINNEE